MSHDRDYKYLAAEEGIYMEAPKTRDRGGCFSEEITTSCKVNLSLRGLYSRLFEALYLHTYTTHTHMPINPIGRGVAAFIDYFRPSLRYRSKDTASRFGRASNAATLTFLHHLGARV